MYLMLYILVGLAGVTHDRHSRWVITDIRCNIPIVNSTGVEPLLTPWFFPFKTWWTLLILLALLLGLLVSCVEN